MINLIERLMHERTDWLEYLANDLHIAVVRDGTLASLKYNQIESPMANPLVQQCRGMVVDVERRKVLAWPYNKFWNHGEALAAPVDWATARVQEKLDGSLIIAYHDRDRWHVASSGHPTAGGSFGTETSTFRDAFWTLERELGMDVSRLEPTVTFMFELCHAPNRVVVRHERPRLVMHGARDMVMGRELSRIELEMFARAARCELVDEYQISSIADCLAAAEALDPLKQEGFVVVDEHFNRVKIKSPRYVILHHLKGEATPRRAIELWQTGDTDELLNSFPEFQPIIQPVQDQLKRIAEWCVKDFADHTPCADRKTFAMAVKHRPWASVLFKMLGDWQDGIGVNHPDVEAAKAIMRKSTTAALERMLAG